jgi:dual oxidase
MASTKREDGPYLNDEEIDEFLQDLDENSNGEIEYSEIEFKLDEVHSEIAPKAQPHNLHHKDRDSESRHEFLRGLMGSDKDKIPRDEFKEIVKTWKVPSMKPDKKAQEDHKDYMKRMSIWRRIRAYWEVRGPEMVFLVMVVSMQIAFGVWQCV